MARTSTRFLKGREVWQTLTELVSRSRRTTAAIAYLGRSGGKHLPLKPGDTLVVDMSLGAVRQGVTDPKEVEKFFDGDVRIFSRANLHAKVVITDEFLVVGSMNASTNSAEVLDEAAVMTNSRAARARALRTIRGWAVERVLPGQLAEAISEYRAPEFKAAVLPPVRHTRRRDATQSRLWLLVGLVSGDVPEHEKESADEAEREASRGFRRRRDTDAARVSFAHRSKFYAHVRRNDWVVRLFRDGDVLAPARVRGKASYVRGGGKRRYIVGLEYRDAAPSTWAAFRRAHHRAVGIPLAKKSRTKGFDDAVVDRLLGCWSRTTGQPLKRYFAVLPKRPRAIPHERRQRR